MIGNLLQKTGLGQYTGSDADVVITTRVRLARNFPTLSFPHKLNNEKTIIFKSLLQKFASEPPPSCNVINIEIKNLNEIERCFLRERGLITKDIERLPNSMALIDINEQFVILINEEDHFRIFLIRPGFELRKCIEEVERIDNHFNKFVPYAYSSKYGYLTSKPLNAGSGLKVSFLVFLPAFALRNEIAALQDSLESKNAIVEQFLSDTSNAKCALYIVRNAYSFGLTMRDIENSMEHIVNRIIDEERKKREDYYFENQIKVEDIVWRSWGIIAYSRCMPYVESIQHLNNIRLGIILGIVKNINLQKIDDLMINVQGTHLQLIHNRVFRSADEEEECRSEYLRNCLCKPQEVK
ncbi:MAG: hypothetical protein N2316_08650 [Spirochaetes bacterium]|nr:hypothetical protein [Spirochaetota bacterium]